MAPVLVAAAEFGRPGVGQAAGRACGSRAGRRGARRRTRRLTPLGPFAERYVEACRFARLRRWPERPGEAALRLERADWYAWADTLPKASAEVHVGLIGEIGRASC